jgi:long-subunit acyl-CoA synthetase (AMP-forming)
MELVAKETPVEPTHPLPTDVAAIIYTSGTTGTGDI